MVRRATTGLALALVSLLLIPAMPTAARPAEAERVIVILDATAAGPRGGDPDRLGPGNSDRIDARRVTAQVRGLRSAVGFRPDHVYRHVVAGFSARLTPAQQARLGRDPSVTAVIADQRIHLEAGSPDIRTQGSVVTRRADGRQVLPTGIRRIHAERNLEAAIGGDGGAIDADAAVLDAGVSYHPDLDVAGGYNCTDKGTRSSWGDVMGHGTHVAGIIGALDNEVGVVGVAPGTRVWSVKIIGDDNIGWVSWAVCGLDWVVGRQDPDGRPTFEVANMSVGGPLSYANTPCGRGTYDIYHQAVCRVVEAGIPVVVAAANDASNARYVRPAAYEEAITVSALADFDGLPGGKGRQADICPWYSVDRDDTYADFSNYGPAVDIIAPGKCILSTYPGNRLAWMSGTSMATPHVAGAAILYRQRYPDALPGQVRQALRHVANDRWFRWSDPDDQEDWLLDVTDFDPPPTFEVALTAPTSFLGTDGVVRIGVRITRHHGHRDAIGFSPTTLEDGLAVAPVAIRGKSGTAKVRGTVQLPSGSREITLRATDGELRLRAPVRVKVDMEAPTGSFSSPVGLTLTADPASELAWSQGETGGSGMAGRTLAHESGAIVTPGTCEGVVFGRSEPVDVRQGSVEGLATGRCHRWSLTLRDRAGNVSVIRSGRVLVDTTPPSSPTASATGVTGVYARAGSDRIWVRRSLTGDIPLVVEARDAQSGIRRIRTAPLTSGSGWAYAESVPADGTPLVVRKGPNATNAFLPLRAVNRLGLVGRTASFELRLDGTPPVPGAWIAPAKGTTAASGTTFTPDWARASDTGSGAGAAQLLQRQRAPVSTDGTCDGVAFVDDGAAVLVAPGVAQPGLLDATCYRWVLRVSDNVGNAGRTVVSGKVLVEAAAS